MLVDGEGVLLEDAEHATATAAHLGIDGSKVVELLLQRTNGRMEGEDGLLEVVGQFIAPCLNGLPDDVTAAFQRLARRDLGKGVTSGYGDGRLG